MRRRYRPGQPHYLATVRRCDHGDPQAVRVAVKRSWWRGPGQGTTTQDLFDFCIPEPEGDTERELVARALEAAVAALRG